VVFCSGKVEWHIYKYSFVQEKGYIYVNSSNLDNPDAEAIRRFRVRIPGGFLSPTRWPNGKASDYGRYPFLVLSIVPRPGFEPARRTLEGGHGQSTGGKHAELTRKRIGLILAVSTK
jgi:hypothetical protein